MGNQSNGNLRASGLHARGFTPSGVSEQKRKWLSLLGQRVKHRTCLGPSLDEVVFCIAVGRLSASSVVLRRFGRAIGFSLLGASCGSWWLGPLENPVPITVTVRFFATAHLLNPRMTSVTAISVDRRASLCSVLYIPVKTHQ